MLLGPRYHPTILKAKHFLVVNLNYGKHSEGRQDLNSLAETYRIS